ncbi:general substrate transporter (plasmid) [Cupriavidus necator N-1]|uniref:General substrate transporter n=1 Tax=Cupriavidus necator (strain ATCC 43291 / DSM 13513 / CCUG 52238 / LMG 8453 / N-1) TaxID=1042878 RepID=F8GY13_CUPNN|nr:MFS transporter [Cupriavidus necator]AEI83137.1 general substrate transporter [Cupriavidus necator N-1]MDX6008545.1 MFS transporter [Cupriavidus necator]
MNTLEAPAQASATAAQSSEMRKVILGSSLGTAFEWYDFFIYGALATALGPLFFPPSLGQTAAFLASLATFGVGLVLRPFGSLIFGRLGDIVGRKYTFLVTIIMMGISTVGVGLLPTYATAGALAPFLLVLLRCIQGLALGGEYGGAATYVAEHARPDDRGRATGWIQLTATAGFVLSLVVVTTTQSLTTAEQFASWGWRVPFLFSIFLLALSIFIRSRLNESPVFLQMKAEGKLSKKPIRDAFGNWANLKYVLLALFGTVAGVTVIWYTGQFFALIFLMRWLKVDPTTAYWMVSIALILGSPFFVLSGRLSDRFGRKKVILFGFISAVALIFPIFKGVTHFANPALERASAEAPVTIHSSECRLRPFSGPETSCEKAREILNNAGVPYTVVPSSESGAVVRVKDLSTENADKISIEKLLASAGYPAKADPAQINRPAVILLIWILVVLGCIAYGPNAAYLVELFPTRVRYSSMSMAYHIGTGYFGGFALYFATLISTTTGDIYSGLFYPLVIATISILVTAFLLPETKGWTLDR